MCGFSAAFLNPGEREGEKESEEKPLLAAEKQTPSTSGRGRPSPNQRSFLSSSSLGEKPLSSPHRTQPALPECCTEEAQRVGLP